MLLENIQ
jgi:hypothetical protein